MESTHEPTVATAIIPVFQPSKFRLRFYIRSGERGAYILYGIRTGQYIYYKVGFTGFGTKYKI
ncbi:hypothetical protein DW713_03110 [Bacteroides stercoris]|nr:hypothetical protein DW713_03110 [Bacteroides stercoris]